MNETPEPRPEEDLDKLAPQKLLKNFTQNRVLLCLGIALGVHVIILCGSSPRYIYEGINPEAKARRIEREQKEAQIAVNARLAAGMGSGATGEVVNASSDKKEVSDADRKESAVYKEITETAESDAIPRTPDDIDISLEDTSF
jgi:hypothetical protein